MTIDLSNLAALRFQTADLTPEMGEWCKNPENLAINAQSCFRTVLLGLRNRFEAAPCLDEDLEQPEQQKFRLRTGKDAYIYLLRILTGLTDQQEFDPHSKKAFEARWKRLTESRIGNPELIAPYIYALRSDCDLIFGRCTKHIVNVRTSNVVNSLLSSTLGPNALIITDRAGMPRHSLGMLHYQSEAYRPDFQDIGLYSTADTDRFVKDFETQQRKGRIPKAVYITNFNDETLAQAFELYPVVYIEMMLNKNPELECFILDCWKNRSRRDNLMISMLTTSASRGTSPIHWQQAAQSQGDIILGETIEAQANLFRASNQTYRAHAHDLVLEIAEARARGVAPSSEATPDGPKLGIV